MLEFGGALSGEHGDGLIRSPFMEKMFGPVLYGAFQQVKRTFDPDGIFNPGKIVGAPPLTSNLRYGAGYQPRQPVTFFDYSEYGGMSGAVEMCSGLGACRKKLDGTMCPSYMATREEKHSTRGRANALRLAMAGRLGESGLGDEGVREVLDLCLECRACKAECPVGVDVARFKSEFLADYWSRHGTPLRARFLGGIHDVSRWASRLAPLSTWMAQSAPGRWMAEALLGIDARRTPPAWTTRTFRQRFESGSDLVFQPNVEIQDLTPIRMFVDTFTNYYNPQVGMAGAKVLQAAGLQVSLAPNGCCGRPLISQGLLAEARAAAAVQHRYAVSAGDIRRAVRVLRAELPVGHARRRSVAACEEKRSDMLRRWRRNRCSSRNCSSSISTRTRRRSPSLHATGTIVLHGHCHQKAMGLLPPAKALLSRIPGATVVDLDAGCCGMAGSFGYAVEHFDVSRAIGERRLLPAARRLEPTDVLVAAGVSCRHQIADFTSARALHPAELLGALVQETA